MPNKTLVAELLPPIWIHTLGWAETLPTSEAVLAQAPWAQVVTLWGGLGLELSRASKSLGWAWPSLAKSLGKHRGQLPWHTLHLGFPCQGVRWTLGATPRAAWHAKHVLTLWPSSPSLA